MDFVQTSLLLTPFFLFTPFSESNIIGLFSLRMLNLRGNKFKNINYLCDILDRLASDVEVLFIDENPCYVTDDPTSRVRFFKKLKRKSEDLKIKSMNGHPVSSHDLVLLGQSKRKPSNSNLRGFFR